MNVGRLLVLGVSVVAVTAAQPSGSAKSPQPARQLSKPIPRAPDGHPDLQGIWTNSTLTHLERPQGWEKLPALSDEQAREVERRDRERAQDPRPGEPLILGDLLFEGANIGYNVLFIDRGSELARVAGAKRTSLVVDPPDGKIPPITPEARSRNAAVAWARSGVGGVKGRPLSERCIVDTASGPPMLPGLYNNNYQIVQTADFVMILAEMVHDVRIVRMNASHPPKSIGQWVGDSVGRWEGDTLVVDTTNFTDQTRFKGSSSGLHVIERFQRLDNGTILYRATIDDPTTFSKSWAIEYPFSKASGPVYEYACHEGNYALPAILRGVLSSEGGTEK